MFLLFLKFGGKLTPLNKTEQSSSVNKVKSALLTLLNQYSLKFFKSYTALHSFATNHILFQKYKKVEVPKLLKYIQKLTIGY